MSEHTPGPWHAFFKAKYDEWHVLIPMADSTMRFALFDDGVRSEHPEADARLIAAAPDLLEALHEARQCLLVWSPVDAAIFEKIDAAIAKAEGRS